MDVMALPVACCTQVSARSTSVQDENRLSDFKSMVEESLQSNEQKAKSFGESVATDTSEDGSDEEYQLDLTQVLLPVDCLIQWVSPEVEELKNSDLALNESDESSFLSGVDSVEIYSSGELLGEQSLNFTSSLNLGAELKEFSIPKTLIEGVSDELISLANNKSVGLDLTQLSQDVETSTQLPETKVLNSGWMESMNLTELEALQLKDSLTVVEERISKFAISKTADVETLELESDHREIFASTTEETDRSINLLNWNIRQFSQRLKGFESEKSLVENVDLSFSQESVMRGKSSESGLADLNLVAQNVSKKSIVEAVESVSVESIIVNPEAATLIDVNAKQVALNEAKGVSPIWSNASEIYDQMVKHATLLKDGDSSVLTLKLMPQQLGTLQIELTLQDGQLTGRIVTETAEIGQWVENQVVALPSEGGSLRNVQVEVQVSESLMNFGQSEKDSSRESSSSKKSNYYGLDEEDDLKSGQKNPDVRLVL